MAIRNETCWNIHTFQYEGLSPPSSWKEKIEMHLFVHMRFTIHYKSYPNISKCLINYDKNINVCTKSVNFLSNFTCTLTFHFMCEQNLMTWNLKPYFFGTLCLPFNFNKKIMFLQNLMTEFLNHFIYTLCIPFNVQIKL